MYRRILSCFLAVFAMCSLFSCAPSRQPDGEEASLPAYSGERVIYPIRVGDVVLQSGMLYEKQQANADYLKSLDVPTLLYFFYVTAGLDVPAGTMPYGGWEAGNTGGSVAGHTLGHYLSALSMLYASTGEAWCLERVNAIVTELGKCQAESGYLMSRPEEDFSAVLRGDGSNSVLFYTVHKILAGLYDAYTYAGSKEALSVACGMMDWIYDFTSPLSESQCATVLRVEYGGMNEVAYNIYAVTGDEDHLAVAEFFNEKLYLDAWSSGKDNLTGIHANTQIPKAVGFARGYMLTGDETLLDAAEFFWEIVAESRTFATGGNSEGEAFGYPEHTSDQIWYNPDETCNIYNMSKLSACLFAVTGDVKYADYMERALLNGLAGSIDEDGCKTYYQWLCTDAKKLFHSPEDSFWCCTGTGMETFSKLGSMIGFLTDRGLIVNIYENAVFRVDDREVTLTGDGQRNLFTFSGEGRMELMLRVPYYVSRAVAVLNGMTVEGKTENGYFILDRIWHDGDELEFFLPYGGYYEETPDDPDTVAVKYGPYLLAAVGKRYEKKNFLSLDALVSLSALVPDANGDFTLSDGGETVVLRRYADIANETYTVYFRAETELPEEALTKDPAMRASVSCDFDASYSRPDRLSANIWYDASGLSHYLEAVNDGIAAKDSSSLSPYANDLFRFTSPFLFVPAGGKTGHYIQYDFDGTQTLTETGVYFAAGNGTAIPSSFEILYLSDGTWKTAGASVKTVRDGFSTLSFDPIETESVRLVIRSDSPCGIIEWQIH